MQIENEIWDQIIAGTTGNPFTELEIINKAKEEITQGINVFLTFEGRPIYKVEFLFDTQTFSKIFISF